jgi:hypothetical protein
MQGGFIEADLPRELRRRQLVVRLVLEVHAALTTPEGRVRREDEGGGGVYKRED